MPSKYSKEFTVPKDFPSVLKSFTREVLRSQPDNIYEFGASYFTDLLAQAEAAMAADEGSVKRLSPAELEELLVSLFREADKDGSGALSLHEFKDCLASVDLGLPESEARRILCEADINGDNEIEYAEFVPLAVDLVQSMYAKMEAQALKEAEEAEALEEAQQHLMHGMTQAEVEMVMKDVFHKADADGSGALSLAEFQKCCKEVWNKSTHPLP